MPAFDMVVVGSGGGPDETNLSGYLIKPYDKSWEDGIVGIEAGSGKGALSALLRRNPDLFGSTAEGGDTYTPNEIYSFVRSFLITHAHLDHCSSLILSAGSFAGSRKTIYAAHQTLKDLEGVFADRIWPNLASWDKDDEPYKLLYSPLSADGNYELVAPHISVRTMPLSHGFSGSGVYESAAFFVRHDPTQKQFLFFGDVEPDSLAERPHTIDVWRAAAPMIPQVLSTVFIECSWQLGRKDSMLYGHLSPEHLAVELEALATEVVLARDRARRLSSTAPSPPAHKETMNNASVPVERLRGALDGLRVRIIHCKDADEHSGPGRRPVSHVICDQIRALVDAQGLGAEILPTDQGTRIEI